jgi:hypothetical protein
VPSGYVKLRRRERHNCDALDGCAERVGGTRIAGATDPARKARWLLADLTLAAPAEFYGDGEQADTGLLAINSLDACGNPKCLVGQLLLAFQK